MKKLKFVCLSLVTLFLVVLGIVFGGVDVLAYTYNSLVDGEDFSPYIDQIVYCDVTQQDGVFIDSGGYVYLFIDDLDNKTFQFRVDDFHPVIQSTVVNDLDWSEAGFMRLFGDAGDSLYWNPWEQYWQLDYPYHEYFDIWGAPLSAKDYVDLDGKGIRLYIQALYGDSLGGELDFAVMRPVRNYYFGVGQLIKGNAYQFGRNFFDSDLLDDWVQDALQFWGSGTTIQEWDRVYVVYDVDMQRFVLEWHGINYWEFWITRYFGLNIAYNELQIELETAFDNGFTEGFVDGYYVGKMEGYQEGIMVSESEAYEEGFKAGQKSKLAENNQAFYQGIEKWLVPAIIAVIALGGFVTIAVNKRRGE